jgi:hypothetical protein
LFLVATVLLTRLSSTLDGAAVELSAALLVFPPVLMGVLGGQLLALSMVLYGAAMLLDRRRDDTSEVLLGVVFGAWLFKPHYALLALLVPLVQGRFRVVLGFLIPAAIYFALGVQVLGMEWPSQWMLFARDFAEMNYQSNAGQMSNIVGATLALMNVLHVDSNAMQIGRVAGLFGCGLVMMWLLMTAWRDRGAIPREGELPSRPMLLLGPVLAFASPQANFYDLGLAVMPLVLLLRPTVKDWMLHLGGCVVLASIAVTFKESIVALFALVALVIFCLIAFSSG